MNATPGQRFDRIDTGQAYRPPTRALDPRQIVIQPGWNVRDMSTPETVAWIALLKAAILSAGYDQTKPISVRYDAKTGVATLVDGQCRLTACKELRKEGTQIWIPCVVTEGDEAELTAEAMAGNAGQPLTQWEIGAGCKRLLRFGQSIEWIAARICKPTRYVKEAIALSNVSLDAKSLLAAGTATPGAVLHAISGKDGDSVEALKSRVAARPTDATPKQASLPGVPSKAKKAKPVARPKKPSAKEQIAKTAPECLKLADKLSKLVQDNDASWGPCVAAAKVYDKARGL